MPVTLKKSFMAKYEEDDDLTMTGQESTGGDFKRPQLEDATYRARICSIVDLGTHEKKFKNDVKQERQLRIGFELLDEEFAFKEGEDPKPVIQTWKINNSTNEKAKLMKLVAKLDKSVSGTFLDGKLGRDERNRYNIFKLIGRPCQVSIENRESGGNSYANVKEVIPPMKGDDKNYREMSNEVIKFFIPSDNATLEKEIKYLVLLHPKTRAVIYDSPEWKQFKDEAETKELEKRLEDMYNEMFGGNDGDAINESDDDNW